MHSIAVGKLIGTWCGNAAVDTRVVLGADVGQRRQSIVLRIVRDDHWGGDALTVDLSVKETLDLVMLLTARVQEKLSDGC